MATRAILELVRLMRAPIPSTFSKKDVVQAHVQSAIQMVAINADPISVHLVIMACDEIQRTLAGQRGNRLPWDEMVAIIPEARHEYRKLRDRAYNFFKHARNDADKSLDTQDLDLFAANELMLFMQIHAHRELFGDLPAMMHVFRAWMTVRHPKYIKADLSALTGFSPHMLEQIRALPLDEQLRTLRVHLRLIGGLPE